MQRGIPHQTVYPFLVSSLLQGSSELADNQSPFALVSEVSQVNLKLSFLKFSSFLPVVNLLFFFLQVFCILHEILELPIGIVKISLFCDCDPNEPTDDL